MKRKSVCVCAPVCVRLCVCALWQQNNRRKLWAAWKTQQGGSTGTESTGKVARGKVLFGSLGGSPDGLAGEETSVAVNESGSEI